MHASCLLLLACIFLAWSSPASWSAFQPFLSLLLKYNLRLLFLLAASRILPAASCLLFLLCSSFASCFFSLLFCCLLLLLGLLVLLGVQACLSVTNNADTMLARSILSFIWISKLLDGVVRCAFLEEFPNWLHAFVYCLGLLSRSRREVHKTDEHKTPFPKDVVTFSPNPSYFCISWEKSSLSLFRDTWTDARYIIRGRTSSLYVTQYILPNSVMQRTAVWHHRLVLFSCDIISRSLFVSVLISRTCDT